MVWIRSKRKGILHFLVLSLTLSQFHVLCAPSLKLFGIRTSNKNNSVSSGTAFSALQSKYSGGAGNETNNSGESQEYSKHLRNVLQDEKVKIGP
jgi:hypothetical protein